MMKRLALFLIIVTLCLAASLAQGRRGGFGAGRARGGPVHMDERTALDVLAVLLYLAPSGRTLLISDVPNASQLRPHIPRSASASCVMAFTPSPSAPALEGLPRHGPHRPRLIACNSS